MGLEIETDLNIEVKYASFFLVASTLPLVLLIMIGCDSENEPSASFCIKIDSG